jgi:hypothetical protein
VKNPIILTSRDEIHQHVLGLWRSAPIRASHAEGGFIHDIVDQYASLPRLFCDSTDDRLERAHFCSWWGVTMNRSYDNPSIEDLYRLHEMFPPTRPSCPTFPASVSTPSTARWKTTN